VKLKIPKIGIAICNSGASNTGTLTGLAAVDVVKKYWNMLVTRVGCHNECAKKILDSLGIKYAGYLNLEYDLKIKKLGPFTTFKYSEEDVRHVSSAIREKIRELGL